MGGDRRVEWSGAELAERDGRDWVGKKRMVV